MKQERNHIDHCEENSAGFLFIGDADNLAHNDNHRGCIIVPAFARLLRRRGVSEAVMIGHWFSSMEEKFWAAANVECLSSHCNADELIAETLKARVKRGARRIILGSGDGVAFADLVADLSVQGVEVHVLANRSGLSQDLRAVAAGYAYTDRFVCSAANHNIPQAA